MKFHYIQFSRAYYAAAASPLPSGAYDEIHVDDGAGGYLTVEFHWLAGSNATRIALWDDGVSLLATDPGLLDALTTADPTPAAVKAALNARGYEDATPDEPR